MCFPFLVSVDFIPVQLRGEMEIRSAKTVNFQHLADPCRKIESRAMPDASCRFRDDFRWQIQNWLDRRRGLNRFLFHLTAEGHANMAVLDSTLLHPANAVSHAVMTKHATTGW